MPETHNLYKRSKRSIKNINIINLVSQLDSLKLCVRTGNHDQGLVVHAVPENLDPHFDDISYKYQYYYRHADCSILADSERCEHCTKYNKSVEKAAQSRNCRQLILAKDKAPISLTSPNRLKLTLQAKRLKCKQLENRLEEMEVSLKKMSVNVDSEIRQDLIQIFGGAKEISPFMNLFWQQQKKLFPQAKSGRKFHPI